MKYNNLGGRMVHWVVCVQRWLFTTLLVPFMCDKWHERPDEHYKLNLEI